MILTLISELEIVRLVVGSNEEREKKPTQWVVYYMVATCYLLR